MKKSLQVILDNVRLSKTYLQDKYRLDIEVLVQPNADSDKLFRILFLSNVEQHIIDTVRCSLQQLTVHGDDYLDVIHQDSTSIVLEVKAYI